MPDLEEYEHDESAVACENVICKHVTDKGGVLVEFEDGEEAWIPQNQIHDDSEVYEKGQEGRLVITRWIAEKKGWA